MIAIVRWTRALGAACLVGGLVACSDETTVAPAGESGIIEPSASVAANTQVTVQVPASMTAAPFDVPRQLTVPTGFQIAVYARVAGARFMAVTPDGNLLVSRPGSGRIVLIRPNTSGDPLVSDFATGLSRPHDLVFTTIGATTRLQANNRSPSSPHAAATTSHRASTPSCPAPATT